MAYLTSNNIKVYPTALRGGVEISGTTSIIDPESRLSTESNINSAVNRLSIDGSFVINDQLVNDSLEFSIKGYYFKVTSVKALTDLFTAATGKTIYANIRLAELAQESYKLKSLVAWETNMAMNLDVGINFVGINFSESNEESITDNKFSLAILSYVDNAWIVPGKSKLRYDADMIMIDDTKNDAATTLHNVISKSESNININATNVNATEFTGHFTGDLDGNAKTATDSAFAAKYGTSTSHPAIGSSLQPVYVDSDGVIKVYNDSKGGFATNNSKYTSVYVKNGVVQSGQTIYFSTSKPTGTANEGDVWYQYI